MSDIHEQELDRVLEDLISAGLLYQHNIDTAGKGGRIRPNYLNDNFDEAKQALKQWADAYAAEKVRESLDKIEADKYLSYKEPDVLEYYVVRVASINNERRRLGILTDKETDNGSV